MTGERIVMRSANSRRSSQRGYSIIEVMIAMGLLATVMLSIAALFLFGRKSVYSGKQMTRAVAIANDVLEDLANISADSAYSAFGITQDTVLGDVDLDELQVLPGDLHTNSVVRSTEDITDDTDPQGFLQRWKDIITDPDTSADTMTNGKVFLVFTPTEDPAADPPEIASATLVRIRVVVRWTEDTRARQVIMNTVRTNR